MVQISLKEYDDLRKTEKRQENGVYYTPKEVASFIVKATDEILKTYKLGENPPNKDSFTNTLKTPSGEPKVGSGNFTVKK